MDDKEIRFSQHENANSEKDKFLLPQIILPSLKIISLLFYINHNYQKI